MPKKRTTEEIKEIVESLGYEFIEKYVGVYKKTRVVIKDFERYKYDVLIDDLVKNHLPSFVSKFNPFTLENNIPLWLEINNKTFKLAENNVYLGNNKKLFFSCEICSETFDSTWDNIYSQGQGCSYCSGRRVGRFNNLEYLRPDIVKEWNFDKNIILPSEVTLGLGKKVWWICQDEHEWESIIANRTNGQGCPYCSGRRVSDRNRLSILYPEIASEWHPTKNEDKTPDDFSFGSGEKAWWVCKDGHEWETTINSRTSLYSGCPVCSESRGEKCISMFLGKWNIDFIPEYKFENCVYKKELPFDFAIFDSDDYLHCLVEYHGIQHYEPVDFAGYGKKWAEDQFKELQKRDKIKANYCMDNDIPLKIIPHWEFNNIEQILAETLYL